MASTRTKSTYDVNQEDDKLKINFKEKADYVLVDINKQSVMISLGYEDKPYDEMVTLRLNAEIDTQLSKYEFKKDDDKLVNLTLVKKDSVDYEVKAEHKFIEKKNHPKADPRGYSVKKPEPKNWDKIISDLDAESDEGEPDANQALKKIYDGCDDDTKRAMEKSLYESQGTVLNMDWGQVGKGKVKPYESSDADNFKGFDRDDESDYRRFNRGPSKLKSLK